MMCFKPRLLLLSLVVGGFILSLPACKTTKASNRAGDDLPHQAAPQPQEMPRTIVSAVASSTLHIDSFTLSQPVIAGNAIVQGEISTSQPFDYVAYEIAGRTAESSTLVFTIADAPVGPQVLSVRLCLRDTSLATPCGEALSQSFIQAAAVQAELQQQMVAVETAQQEILQENKDLAEVASTYIADHADEKSDFHTIMSNISSIGPDATNNIIAQGGLTVIEKSLPATADSPLGSEGPTSVTIGKVGGEPSPPPNVLLYLGVPTMVIGAATFLSAGIYHRYHYRAIGQKKHEKLRKTREDASIGTKNSALQIKEDNLLARNKMLQGNLDRAFDLQNTYERADKLDLGKEQGPLKAVFSNLSAGISIGIEEDTEIKKIKGEISHLSGGEHLKELENSIAEILALEARKISADTDIAFYRNAPNNIAALEGKSKARINIITSENELIDAAGDSLPDSTKDWKISLANKRLELEKIGHKITELRTKKVAIDSAINTTKNDLATVTSRLEAVKTKVSRYPEIAEKMQSNTSEMPFGQKLKQAMDEVRTEITAREKALADLVTVAEIKRKTLHDLHVRAIENKKDFEISKIKAREGNKKEIEELKNSIEENTNEIAKLQQEFTSVDDKVDSPRDEIKVKEIEAKTLRAIKVSAATLALGAILTTVSQTAMGLTEDSVMNDQAFALVQLDSIEQRMRESLAKSKMAEYKITTILNE